MIVETGTGITNANSYSSLAEALAYFEESFDTAWPALSDDDQEKNLVLATRYLDRRFGAEWIGARKTSTQGLDWPRIGVRPTVVRPTSFLYPVPGLTDSNGFSLENIVPINLKRAQWELAKSLVVTATLYPTTQTTGVASESLSVGGISIATTYANASTVMDTNRQVLAEVEDLLTDLLNQGSANTAMVARF